MHENVYDPSTRQWVTAESRYQRLVAADQFTDLEDNLDVAPATAWAQLLTLIAEAPDDLLGYVGAGPLQSFIWRYGEQFIDAIEAEACTSARFRRSAFEISLERGHLAADVEHRIVSAIGMGFELLPEH